MRVETPAGVAFRLTYGTETGGRPAVGFDRSRLDPALLDLAIGAGADVRLGWRVTEVDPAARRLAVSDPDGGPRQIRASVVVGADGPHSVVARAAGVARRAWLAPRIGLTYHLADPDPAATRDARMRVLRDGYVGIAPVAGGRVNIGIVLGGSWREALARDGARAVAAAIVAATPPTDGDPASWRLRRSARHRRGRLAARPSRDATRGTGLAARRRCGRFPRPVHGRRPPSGARLD